MINYHVSFFRKADKEKDETEDQFLGSIVIDDHGVDNNLTLTAKAFRVASPNVLTANKVIVEEL